MEIPMDISTWDDKCMQAFIRENASMFRVFAFQVFAGCGGCG